jgi:hypothetical protein
METTSKLIIDYYTGVMLCATKTQGDNDILKDISKISNTQPQ